MLIPRHWSRASGSADDPEGKRYLLKIWGWSEDSLAAASDLAKRRLAETVARVAGGMLGKDPYFYGKTPLREEIARALGDSAVVTRNRYGALVLNAARVPFIDVDIPDSDRAGGGFFAGLFGGKKADPAAAALERVRSACAKFPRTSFRIYRTAAGLRLLATDLLLDPKAGETESMMAEFGADPYFVKICKLQASFRARLTPKPWRCGLRLPPGSYPFESLAVERAFAEWLRTYEAAIASKATCAFVESAGPGRTEPEAVAIVAEHDRACKVGERLPLA